MHYCRQRFEVSRILTLLTGIDANHLTVETMDSYLGFVARCNNGISRSTGDYILLLNPDYLLVSNAIHILS
jgi:hypothetical protein